MDQQIIGAEQIQIAGTAVSFEMTKEDSIAFNQYFVTNSPMIKRQRTTIRVVFLLLMLLFAVLSYGASGSLFVPIYFVTMGVLFAAGLPALQQWGSRRLMRKLLKEGQNRALFGPRTVTVTSDGVEMIGDALETRVKWSLVEKVAASKTHIFLYISSMSAFVIPNTAFASDTEREHFMEMTLQYREQAAGLR